MLLGLKFSKTMRAIDTSVAVLKQAFKMRSKSLLGNTIFHSDGLRVGFLVLCNQYFLTVGSLFSTPFLSTFFGRDLKFFSPFKN